VTDIVAAEQQPDPLAKLDNAKLAIYTAQNLDEIKEIRDQAEAARYYVKAAGLGKDMADRCAEIRLRAERRAGEMLKGANLKPGRPTKKPEPPNPNLSGNDEKSYHGGSISDHKSYPSGSNSQPADNIADSFKLDDLGISANQSSRWQKLANIPEETFEDYFTQAPQSEKEITAVGLTQFSARQNKPDSVDDPIPPKDGTFRAIVIDPPWPIKKIERDERPNQGVELDYPTLTLEQIADESIVPVRTHADDDCHLYLWVTHKFLPAGLELMEKWGFRYQCVMTWRKNVGITPFSWMYDTEHVLFGTRGNLPLERKGIRLSFEAKVQGHSVKPDVFYERVTEATPGPRIEMFARRKRDGFEAWGNEIND
jgi:N6-adenosine-specific RNA methylase IME4